MFRLTVEDVFFIANRGLVATGKVEEGSVRVGDRVSVDDRREATVDGVEMFRKKVDTANPGDNVGLLFKDLTKGDVDRGSVITGPGTSTTLAPDQQAAMREAGLAGDEPRGRRKWFGRG